MDRSRARELITVEDHQIAKSLFLSETPRLARPGHLAIVPIKLPILKKCWKVVEKHHIYQADALQIASTKSINTDEFLVADKKLHQIALEEGLTLRYTESKTQKQPMRMSNKMSGE